MKKKAIPVGYEDFKEITDKNFYYIDKTHMIKELLDQTDKVSLFTRPRRFGKTLNLSMIRRFFEREMDFNGQIQDNSYLFEKLFIGAAGDEYTQHMGKYPVINLSLKSAKQASFDMSYEALKYEIEKEFDRHQYVLMGTVLSEREQVKYQKILDGEGSQIDYMMSLAFLSGCLKKFHQKEVIILIDEYDVPLENAYFNDFYETMIDFIRGLFEAALKTNQNLAFSVITGCLRISRESIFTGLNNLSTYSLINSAYGDCFGFTQEEVWTMLSFYELEEKCTEVQKWYDGYVFGEVEIYNPWSIINYISATRVSKETFPKAYWSNTSSNTIIRDLIEHSDMETRNDLEFLVNGGFLEKPVYEEITYGDIHDSKDSLWNFLFFTGYLKNAGEKQMNGITLLKLEIPNGEVKSIYNRTILSWFDKKTKITDFTPLKTALEIADVDGIGTFITSQLLETISFFDYAENYYHGFLVGLFKAIGTYYVISNRESGTGRPDIIMKSPSIRQKAYIFELKVAKNLQEMEVLCKKALKQGVEEKYESELKKEGYSDITLYGICFYRKECMVLKK